MRGAVTSPPVPASRITITACVNAYQEAGRIERCLRSLVGKVNSIVVIDGAYNGFPHETPYSTDGTREIAEVYADVVVTKTTAWPTETIKRNYYLRFVPENTWWLRIDADEELVGSFDMSLSGVAYRVELQRTDNPNSYPIHALFLKGNHSRYFGTHHGVWHGRTLIPKIDYPILPGVKLIHHIGERTYEREQARGVYYREVYPKREGEFRGRFQV